MIELKNIAVYEGNFTRNNETGRNKENMGADFSEFINNHIQSPIDADKNTDNVNENEKKDIKSGVIKSNSKLVTYDYFGKISQTGLFSGITVDAVI